MSTLILVYSILAFSLGFLGLKKSRTNAFGGNFFLNSIGAFVWADAAIFGFFWGLVSLLLGFTGNSLLFLFFQSVFWSVRSLGEINYWLHEQFAPTKINPTRPFKNFFSGDSVLFVYQIFWQCTLVIALVASVYFAHLWIKSL